MVQNSNKIWVEILFDRYVVGPKILQAQTRPSDSVTWSSIMSAKNILKDGFSWRAGSGSSSFCSCPWSSLGFIGSFSPYIDIHDIQLTVKDVFSTHNRHTDCLYPQLPSSISKAINNMNFKFNASLEDTFIWNHNTNDTYTTKSGYSWLISHLDLVDIPNSPSSWTWKLQLPEKIKFLFWLTCHNSVPTLSLLNNTNMAQSAICTRCGLQNETFLHYV